MGVEDGTYTGDGAGFLADGQGGAAELPAGALGELAGVELGSGQRGAGGDGEDGEDLRELHFERLVDWFFGKKRMKYVGLKRSE